MNEKKLKPEYNDEQVAQYAGRITRSERAFSLTEVLIAVGILAVAMVFIAGLFPTAIYFSTVSTERTIAAAAADEAFAKIRLYTDSNLPQTFPTAVCDYFQNVLAIDGNEFSYPSDPDIAAEDVKYFWSALCRRLSPDSSALPDDRRVQVTVFVTRKAGFSSQYYGPTGPNFNWPAPVPIEVTAAYGSDQLIINDEDRESFVNAGSTIIDGQTGAIYRVLRRDGGNLASNIVILEVPWHGESKSDARIWAVPPPVGGGRYPCIAVYQKVLRF